jgi:hemerythrin superfamily protein
MSVDAITAITEDHRQLDQLFDRLMSGEGDRRALVGEVVARLTAHARAEESEVYPEIAMLDPAEEAEIGHAEHEHEEAEHLLKKVANLVDSPHFEQALTDLVESVRHHVAEEEQRVLPALREAVDDATLKQLGLAFERARTKLLRTAGHETAAGDGLAEASREELYEMAKQADIPGRSGMNKDELADALRSRGNLVDR